MTRAIYIVLLSREKWWVDFEGRAFGPFATRGLATQEALSLARFLTHSGRQSEVRAPDEDGHYPVIWESQPETRWPRPAPSPFRPAPYLA